MNEKHPNRKKDKHNPYTLMIVEGRYYLSFKDGRGIMQNIEIDKVLYDLFNRFELEDISYLNRVSRHIEHSELTESSLNDRAFYKEESLEETVSRSMEYEQLHKAISKLPETQKRRLLLYFFGELNYEQIAELEGCKYQAKGVYYTPNDVVRFILTNSIKASFGKFTVSNISDMSQNNISYCSFCCNKTVFEIKTRYLIQFNVA